MQSYWLKNERADIRTTTAVEMTGIPERSTHKRGVMTHERCMYGADPKQKASQSIARTVPGTRELCPHYAESLTIQEI